MQRRVLVDEAPAQAAAAQVPSSSSSSVSGAPQGGVATGPGGTAAAPGLDTVLSDSRPERW